MRTISMPDLNIVGEEYGTIEEFYRVNGARPLNGHYTSDHGCGGDSSFNVKPGKSYTWDETKRDMLYGSDIFDDEFESVLKEVEGGLPQAWKSVERPRSVQSTVGQSVSIGRALVSNPRPFNRKVQQRVKQRTVSFFFSVSCPASTPTRDRLRCGCVLMAVCRHMEVQGYQTRIYYAPDFSSGKMERHDDPKYPSQVCLTVLKDFGTRFNLKKMQFPLASESALFHVGCWWNHRFPGTTFDWGWGEGYAVDNDPDRLKNAREFARRFDAVYLSIPMIRKDFGMDVMKVYGHVLEQMEAM